jgi:hypothetical protein
MTGQAHENRLDSGNNREARPTSRVTSAGIVTVSLIMLVIGSLLFLLLSPDLPISLLTIPSASSTVKHVVPSRTTRRRPGYSTFCGSAA